MKVIVRRLLSIFDVCNLELTFVRSPVVFYRFVAMCAWDMAIATVLYLYFFVRVAASFTDLESPLALEVMEKGRRELEVIRTEASSPLHGQCWLNAVQVSLETCVPLFMVCGDRHVHRKM
jgi:hypothetical protein